MRLEECQFSGNDVTNVLYNQNPEDALDVFFSDKLLPVGVRDETSRTSQPLEEASSTFPVAEDLRLVSIQQVNVFSVAFVAIPRCMHILMCQIWQF